MTQAVQFTRGVQWFPASHVFVASVHINRVIFKISVSRHTMLPVPIVGAI